MKTPFLRDRMAGLTKVTVSQDLSKLLQNRVFATNRSNFCFEGILRRSLVRIIHKNMHAGNLQKTTFLDNDDTFFIEMLYLCTVMFI